MTKYGTILVAMAIPVLAFVLWRRHVPPRLAALIAVVPLIVQNWYEPYAWLVIVAIVPWWIETVIGHTRPDVRPWHPIVLGLIGSVLFLTYYYFFLIAGVATLLLFAAQAVRREIDWPQWRRAVLAGGVVLLATSVFWLPFVMSVLAAEHPESMTGWFSEGHGVPSDTFLEASLVGVVCLIGLVFLGLTAKREQLSRALLALLAGTYLWYLIGLPAAFAGFPLVTFRAAPLVPIILLVAGLAGISRVVSVAAASPGLTRLAGIDGVRLAAAILGLIFLWVGSRAFAVGVIESEHIPTAYAERLPNGQIQLWGEVAPDPRYASVEDIQAVVDERFGGPGHPVLLCTRRDVLAVTPYFGFLQWQFYYSNPAAEFSERVSFLRELAASPTPQDFTARSANNRFDRIDGFVLRDLGANLAFDYNDDNFPEANKLGQVTFDRDLFDPASFDVVDLGAVVIAVRRG